MFYLDNYRYRVVESFEDKINRLESKENMTFADEMFFMDEEEKNWHLLYHGIRFCPLERLECIFKTGMVLPLKSVPHYFESMNGEKVCTGIFDYGIDNANMGEYVSVMPRNGSMEFETFVGRSSVYLAFGGDIEARHTHYLPYEEYEKVKKMEGLTKLYSYAQSEYFVKDGINLADLVRVGVDSLRMSQEDINKIIEMMKFYEVKAPLVDTRTGDVLFDLERDAFKLFMEERRKYITSQGRSF